MTDDVIEFFVPGHPAPGGSKRAFVAKATGRVVVKDDCARNKDWRAVVALAGRAAMAGRPPLDAPLSVTWRFIMPRPKDHRGTGRNAGKLKPSAPTYHSGKPDATKLVRAAEDALTEICWRDDALIADQRAIKLYGEPAGVWVTIEAATGNGRAT